MNAAFLVAVLSFAAISSILSSARAQSNERRWGFAREAVSPCSDGGPSPLKYAAPNGSKVLTVEVAGGNSRVYLTVAGARHAVEYAAWPCPELQWSGDSRAVFV